MAEAVAKVARIINSTVEDEKDTLDLSNCKLISFPDGVFKVLRSILDKIQIISLADNELKALTNTFFINFPQLRELDLQGNVLRKLPDALGDMGHLTGINLANNNLSTFPEILTKVRTLEKINMEGNNITEIPVEKLLTMPALKLVNMRSNPLDKDSLTANQSPLAFELIITTDE